ncbi:MAG: FAD-binding oxidoreductase [Gammaproteobacteria bacterium]|nr:FAD-binding oxidoreductase [Gammaproteobacteria bacterium]
MKPDIAYQPDSGKSGWVGILSERHPNPALKADREADYCVVGAGFAGLAAARRILLLNPKASVVILEATQVGSGPAGRNSGFMIDLPHVLSSSSYAGETGTDRRDIKLNRRAIDFVNNMVCEFKMPEESFRAEGKINGAASQKGLRANNEYAEHLDKLGEPCELLDKQTMESITGSSYYLGGLHSPGCAMIQPAMLVQGIAGGLSAYENCRIYEQTQVQAIHKQGDRWNLSTPGGSVLANKVILAVNGFVENFGYYQRRLMHITLYASMTRELTAGELADLGGEERWGITPSNPFGSTVRKISDSGGHRLLIRNRFSYDPSLTLIDNQIEAAEADHLSAFVARFPMLSHVPMEYRWSGRLCLSRNHVWALGEVAENLYSACCQNGLGATKGIIAGIIAAELASECKVNSMMPEFQTGEIPQKLLLEPFMTKGARVYLKLREWQAGKDK